MIIALIMFLLSQFGPAINSPPTPGSTPAPIRLKINADLSLNTYMKISGSEAENCPSCITFWTKGKKVAQISPNGRFQVWDKRGLRTVLRNTYHYMGCPGFESHTTERRKHG